jgi:DNA invertase Pin-like site-specific DNA recombinase
MAAVIIPGGIAEEKALEAWKRRDAEHQAERDKLVRAAHLAGLNKRQIALASGLSRTTVYKILGDGVTV